VNPIAFLLKVKVVVDIGVFRVHPTSELVCHSHTYCSVKLVVTEQERQRQNLENQKNEESKIPTNEKKYVTHTGLQASTANGVWELPLKLFQFLCSSLPRGLIGYELTMPFEILSKALSCRVFKEGRSQSFNDRYIIIIMI
jgi:hypothetical protein